MLSAGRYDLIAVFHDIYHRLVYMSVISYTALLQFSIPEFYAFMIISEIMQNTMFQMVYTWCLQDNAADILLGIKP